MIQQYVFHYLAWLCLFCADYIPTEFVIACPQLCAALEQIARDEEVLASMDWWNYDLVWMRDTIAECRTFPRLSEFHKFGMGDKWLWRQVELADSVVTVARARAIASWEEREYWDEVVRETKRRRSLYITLYCVTDERCGWCQQRAFLAEVRDSLTPAEWYGGRVPPVVPVEMLARVD